MAVLFWVSHTKFWEEDTFSIFSPEMEIRYFSETVYTASQPDAVRRSDYTYNVECQGYKLQAMDEVVSLNFRETT